MRYSMAMGGSANEVAAADNSNIISQLTAKLPLPAQVLLQILIIVAAAAVVGIIIGKMYASIKYPDLEKQHIIPPKIKVAFICVLAICCALLYGAMTREDMPLNGPGKDEQMQDEQMQDETPPDVDDLPSSIDRDITATSEA